jgi:hypothetical protein
MPVARTKVSLAVQPPACSAPDGQMQGLIAMARNFSITDSADTTAAIYVGGMVPCRLANESGGALTFTLYTAYQQDGTAITPYDADVVALTTVTLGDDCDCELVLGIGIQWLVIIAGAAADNITLTCMR